MTITTEPATRRGLRERLRDLVQRTAGNDLALRLVAVRRSGLGALTRIVDFTVTRTAPVRNKAEPFTSMLSSTAATLLVFAIAGVTVGPLLGWADLIVGAILALLLLLASIGFVVGSNELTAVLDLSRSRVVVGERANGRLVLKNPSRRRRPSLIVELPVGSTVASYDIPALKGRESMEQLFAIPTQRRSVLDLGPVRAVRTDPFGLLRRERSLTERDLLHVHPRTVGIRGTASGFIRDLEGETIRKVTDADVSFHALREYQPGDDRRYVHWKSTARTGTLMVRQFEETRRSHLLIVVSTRLEDYADDDELELAVSSAASMGTQTLRDGHEVSVLTSSGTLRSEHPTLLLDQFSGVNYDPRAGRLVDALRRSRRAAVGASVAAIVCGSTVDPAELRRARRLLAPDVRTLGLRHEVGAERSVRVMGDLELVTLGSLDELGGALRELSS